LKFFHSIQFLSSVHHILPFPLSLGVYSKYTKSKIENAYIYMCVCVCVCVKTLTPLLEENVAIEDYVNNGVWDMKMSQFKSKDMTVAQEWIL